MGYQYRREPLLPDEIATLERACASPIERMIVFTLIDTGLRVAELAGLRRSNIDFQSHRLIFRGKGDKRRVIPMSPRIRGLLEHHFAEYDSFPIGRRQVQRKVQAIANRAGVIRKTSPHVFRHSFAVACLQKGISLPTLQRLLGHSNLATTEIYTNLSPEAAIEEFNRKW